MKQQVTELAKQAGDDWDSTRREDKEFLIRFYALVRNAALEQAAQVAEGYPKHGDATAQAIRNLKDKT